MKLADRLAQVLPKGEDFPLLHLQSNPIEISPIVTPERKNINHVGDDYQDLSKCKTVKTQHFFALACENKFVFALEIYVYITLSVGHEKEVNNNNAERLLFVSKADTNGYSSIKFSTKDVTRTILEYLLKIDPNYYLRKIKPFKRKYRSKDKKEYIIGKNDIKRSLRILSTKSTTDTDNSNNKIKLDSTKYYNSYHVDNNNLITKISLFTRPADQYLFMGSVKNIKKHTLDGTQLLNWWLTMIDNITCNNFQKNNTKAFLKIPGDDPLRVRRHFTRCQFDNWQEGDIFSKHNKNNSKSLAVYSIPLFPDDPKSRFLHQLVEENRIYKTNLDTFWIELQERQEFKLSVLVSVIGVEGSLRLPADYEPVPNHDVILANSTKQFTNIKNYITAEEYDTDEGALESFENIVDYLRFKLNTTLIKITGTKECSIESQRLIKMKNKENINMIQVTMLRPRKKPKI